MKYGIIKHPYYNNAEITEILLNYYGKNFKLNDNETRHVLIYMFKSSIKYRVRILKNKKGYYLETSDYYKQNKAYITKQVNIAITSKKEQ